MIETVKTTVRKVELSNYVSDPRDDYRQWRDSDRPIYNAVHAVLEIVLVVGLGLRYLCHMMGYAIYHESKHDEAPDFSDDMFGFNNLVKPVLEPEHWHQEALMRGLTFGVGLFFFFVAVGTSAAEYHMAYESISPTMTYYGRLFLAGHLLLDPLLGVSWRVANADLREWV